jgi:hypothetical protein
MPGRRLSGPSGWLPTPALIGYYGYNRRTWMHSDIPLAWEVYSRQISPLFPNLEHVEWAPSRTEDANYETPFFVPSLTSLRVQPSRSEGLGDDHESDADRTRIIGVLTMTQARCSNLDSLDLGDFKMSIALGTDLESVILSFRCLKVLRCHSPVSRNFLVLVASLHLGLLEISVSQNFTTANVPEGFAALEYLKISRTRVEVINALIMAVQSSSLTVMKLHADARVTPGQVTDLIRIISTHPSARSLQTLTIGANTWDQDPLTYNNIELILRLPKLRHLMVTTGRFDWTPGAIRSMLDACPALECLEIAGHERMSLLDFIDASRNHLFLKHLPVDIVCAADETLPDQNRIRFPYLDYIHIHVTPTEGKSSKHNRTLLARYLAATFPLLPHSHIHGDDKLGPLMVKYQDRFDKERVIRNDDSPSSNARAYAKRGQQALVSMLGLTGSMGSMRH